MNKKIEDINFDDIDLEDYKEEIEEINKEAERLFNDPEIKKLLKKGKKMKRLHKITDFFELVINYGWWKTITGKAKGEYFDLDYFDEDE